MFAAVMVNQFCEYLKLEVKSERAGPKKTMTGTETFMVSGNLQCINAVGKPCSYNGENGEKLENIENMQDMAWQTEEVRTKA